jgi:hypothetical protein
MFEAERGNYEAFAVTQYKEEVWFLMIFRANT